MDNPVKSSITGLTGYSPAGGSLGSSAPTLSAVKFLQHQVLQPVPDLRYGVLCGQFRKTGKDLLFQNLCHGVFFGIIGKAKKISNTRCLIKIKTKKPSDITRIRRFNLPPEGEFIPEEEERGYDW